MDIRELWRTTTFRLTALYGLVFALGTVALLGMVYLQSAVYLTHRLDGILNTEADALAKSPPKALSDRIGVALSLNDDQAANDDHIDVFALFSANGARLAGNLLALPSNLKAGGAPIEVPPTPVFPTRARLIARMLPSGDELVVGRDVSQLREMRSIIASALIWSGVTILVVGLGCGTALSVRPLRRLRVLQAAGNDIAAGDLKRRMPMSDRNDELDMFATTVNYMMGEVDRLMSEVKSSTETIAHDLRTPLTRARAQLHRIQHAALMEPDDIARVIAEIDEVLDRFHALMRISELEARERQRGFQRVDLADIVEQVVELYQPLAEAGGVRLLMSAPHAAPVDADPKLVFEAVSNLVDNAIKFTGDGNAVKVSLGDDPARPQIIVQDDGPGVPDGERSAVLQRFYRGERDRLVPGSGLGLSIVAAIVRLHRFELSLSDAKPGLRVVIDCRSQSITR